MGRPSSPTLRAPCVVGALAGAGVNDTREMLVAYHGANVRLMPSNQSSMVSVFPSGYRVKGTVVEGEIWGSRSDWLKLDQGGYIWMGLLKELP